MPEQYLQVNFDQPQEVFIPGQAISGNVVFSSKHHYEARSISMKFEGVGHTDWTEQERVERENENGEKVNESQDIYYFQDVNYMNYTVLLWSSSDGSNKLPPGSYSWPFSFILPGNVPPSFEGKYGYIRYSATAVADRPGKSEEPKKRLITVDRQIDLNNLPEALKPLHDQDSEVLGCCCFKRGTLELWMDIPKTGFVPGETVPINLHILNYSTKTVQNIKAKIKQRCKFYAFRDGNADSKRETKSDEKNVVTEENKMVIGPGKEHKIVIELKLPSITPTINKLSPVLDVEYVVKVVADTDATFFSDIKLEMGLLIGTVPIRKYLPPSFYPPDPKSEPTMIGAPPTGYVSVPTEDPANGAIPSAPPLSYEDSMYGIEGTELNKEKNELPFVPKYPVFNDLPVYNPTAPTNE